MAHCSHVLRRLLTVAGDKRKVLACRRTRPSTLRLLVSVELGVEADKTALITRLRVQTVLQSCEYASKA